jgi:hypothetical protein
MSLTVVVQETAIRALARIRRQVGATYRQVRVLISGFPDRR